MSGELAIALYLLFGLGGWGLLALLHEYRRRAFTLGREPDRVFRCDRCQMVYTDDPGVERSRCPGCGRTNEPFRF
ncbi:MAG: hypothetical protein ACKOET_17395 [Verrucomicrobiota bacterium]